MQGWKEKAMAGREEQELWLQERAGLLIELWCLEAGQLLLEMK